MNTAHGKNPCHSRISGVLTRLLTRCVPPPHAPLLPPLRSGPTHAHPRLHLPPPPPPQYNISFFGIEKLHPFDAGKFAKVVKALKRDGVVLGDAQVCAYVLVWEVAATVRPMGSRLGSLREGL